MNHFRLEQTFKAAGFLGAAAVVGTMTMAHAAGHDGRWSVLVVTESGILSQADVKLMRDHDVHAFLVGEAFMKADDPGQKLAELFG